MRKLLYIFLLPLLVIDWVVTLLFNVMEVIANAVREIASSLKTFIHAEVKPAKQQPTAK